MDIKNLKLKDQNNMNIEFTHQQANLYAIQRGKNTRFYVNLYGYSVYYTLKPTFATPTHKDYKRCIIIKLKY